MGLGKTVEILALMLMNPRRMGTKRKVSEIEDTEKAPVPMSRNVKCICHNNNRIKNMITCENCSTAQHIKCVFQKEVTQDDRDSYLCPFCWKLEGKLIDAKTTIIVTPASIQSQWNDEIQRHISDKSFNTLTYTGISNGWVSPTELAKYDVVLTDFNTLSKELYFSDIRNDRALRYGKKFEYPPSPLTSVCWWRVVLDEAQMVENKNNRPSLMVKQLPAVNHWATTGTPIEKDSIRCLYGLLFFINYSPFTDERLFTRLCNEYRWGAHKEMIDILARVMWRTCKKNVEHEVNIPEQSNVIHEVEMTDLQKYFYREAHLATLPLFMKNVQEYLRRNGPVHLVSRVKNGEFRQVYERVVDVTMKDKFLYELNNATLKIFLEPLRTLRQDCTIPSIFQKSNDQTRVKQTLKPEELHEHLMSKTSIEAKSALRTVCSSINGIAAIKIAEEKYEEALNLYHQVLKLSKEYTGVVSVDSMIQIHAFHGLIEIATITENEEEEKRKESYSSDMGKLEWKYISNYYEKVKDINKEMEQLRPELLKTTRELTDVDGDWWRDVLAITMRRSDEESKLMDIINLELFSSVTDNSQLIEQLRSTHGIQLVLTEWCDKIQRFTKEVKKQFNKFEYIVKNLCPSTEMKAEDNEKLIALTKAAQSCHLNQFEDEENEENASKKATKKALCELCKLKLKLNEYECVLFHKSLLEEGEEGSTTRIKKKKNLAWEPAASWNARFEEKLLKSVLIYAKRSDFEDELTTMGGNFFKFLESLKSQYKLYAKLWVEVNYTVSAYDELNMCKMRIQVVDSPEEITDEDTRFRLKFLRYEIDDQLQIFAGQKQEADMNFLRLNGRIKYLKHLKDQDLPKVCPICTNQPKERYFVTVCGHSICAECFMMMVKNRNKSISCPVCRTMNETKEIYAVTCNEGQSSSDTPINGSYSPKIDEIISCILRLKKKEPNVKILIFSHWDAMLQAILPGLEANNISYRTSFASNFPKQVQEFKDYSKDVTALMLNLKFAGKGLTLVEATHVFIVEPILKADEEFQAIGRVHRIGQTRETFVHRFITRNTIEETIYRKIIHEKEKWTRKQFSIRDLEELFDVNPVGVNANDNYM
jgi:E3 ubiquitin-protein ligase SHPRH